MKVQSLLYVRIKELDEFGTARRLGEYVWFKDYFFFVPQHIKGGNAILQGQAFVEALSVEEQRHFAEYTGLSFEKNLQLLIL